MERSVSAGSRAWHPALELLTLARSLDEYAGRLYEHHSIPSDPKKIMDNDLFKDARACASLYRAEDLQGSTLFTGRGVLDPFDNTTHFYLTDRTLSPMVNSDGIFADWHTGTLSAMVPYEVPAEPGTAQKDNPLNYLITIGEDAQPYLTTIDMDATTITLGEVVKPKNEPLDLDGTWTYTGAMAMLDDRGGLGHTWVYLKRFQGTTTQIVGVDLYDWTYRKHPEDAFHVLAEITDVHDHKFAYDEMQLSPDGNYLACVVRTGTGDIWADHSILRYALSPSHAQLTKINNVKFLATNVTSIDFSPAGSYIYYVGTSVKGTSAFRIPADANGAVTPEMVLDEAGDVRRTMHHGILITQAKDVVHVTAPDATTTTQTQIAQHTDWGSSIYFLPNVALQPLRIRKDLVETFTRGVDDKRYELKDHLGNVRVVVSDWKQSEYDPEEDVASNFRAKVLSRADYYPFGALLPGRTFDATSDAYRFGFQGQESDKEIHGERNSYAFEYRFHDPRIGRFLSVDPLSPKYPFYSPYAFSGNRVIDAIEFEGLEPGVLFGSQTQVESVNSATGNVNYIAIPLTTLVDARIALIHHRAQGNAIKVVYLQTHGNYGIACLGEGRDGFLDSKGSTATNNTMRIIDDVPITSEDVDRFTRVQPYVDGTAQGPLSEDDAAWANSDQYKALDRFTKMASETDPDATIILGSCYTAKDVSAPNGYESNGSALLTGLSRLTGRTVIANADRTCDRNPTTGTVLDAGRTSLESFMSGWSTSSPSGEVQKTGKNLQLNSTGPLYEFR